MVAALCISENRCTLLDRYIYMYVQGLQWEKIFLPSIFMTPYDVGSGGNQGGVGRKCSHTPTVAVFGMMATESGAPTEN